LDVDEAQIEEAFREAIRIAKEQKSVSLAARAEASYAEYLSQKCNTERLAGSGYLLASYPDAGAVHSG